VARHNLVYVTRITESKPAWDALKNVFEPRGHITMVLLCHKLFQAQCEEGENIKEHVWTLQGYQQEYNSLSPTSPLSDEDFSITMLTSLPDTWNTFISAIDSTALSNSNALIARILEEDRHLRSKGDPNTSLAAREKPKKKKYNPNVTCYNCGKKARLLIT